MPGLTHSPVDRPVYRREGEFVAPLRESALPDFGQVPEGVHKAVVFQIRRFESHNALVEEMDRNLREMGRCIHYPTTLTIRISVPKNRWQAEPADRVNIPPVKRKNRYQAWGSKTMWDAQTEKACRQTAR